MEIFFIRALQLIMALSLLVLVHEFGHFIFSRIFKVRVEKFYLFFDYKFSLFKWKPKNSDTEYGIGWLPLGGYCKISGMIDESMDTEQMKLPPQPYEFRAKPAYQRLLIMIGGVLFNFILALFIYSMILFTWGESYYDVQKATYGMEFNENAKAIGFVDGDILLRSGSDDLKKYDVDLLRKIIDEKSVTVLRDGKEVNITIPEEFGLLDIGKETPFMQYRIPAVIDSILPGSAAALAGIQRGDSITGIAGKNINSWYKLTTALEALKATGDNSVNITAVRDSKEIILTAHVDSTYKLGVMPRELGYIPVEFKYGFFESFPAGAAYGCNVLKGYVSDFKYVFSSEGAKSVGMFGTIGSMFPSVWDWHRFWLMTAFLSIVLAFMNILPIPALDGGHVLFLLVEVITGRKPSDKFLEYAQMVGMIILLGLFLLATYNDITRFLF
ncbi:MAG: RIP metalloprotease RseP [Bacteroidaceae bacterium]|nr:RIP metalloprotease RseP [Bacteroidaceae bacterium]